MTNRLEKRTGLKWTPANVWHAKGNVYLPFPGGQMRFPLLYDAKTRLYWLLGPQAIDSMTRAGRLPPERFDLPYSERHHLVLHFSRNLVD